MHARGSGKRHKRLKKRGQNLMKKERGGAKTTRSQKNFRETSPPRGIHEKEVDIRS